MTPTMTPKVIVLTGKEKYVFEVNPADIPQILQAFRTKGRPVNISALKKELGFGEEDKPNLPEPEPPEPSEQPVASDPDPFATKKGTDTKSTKKGGD